MSEKKEKMNLQAMYEKVKKMAWKDRVNASNFVQSPV